MWCKIWTEFNNDNHCSDFYDRKKAVGYIASHEILSSFFLVKCNWRLRKFKHMTITRLNSRQSNAFGSCVVMDTSREATPPTRMVIKVAKSGIWFEVINHFSKARKEMDVEWSSQLFATTVIPHSLF